MSKETTKKWSLTNAFENAPEKAEELRIDKNGLLYWSDKNKVAWTSGFLSANYSASRHDIIIATKY